MRPTSLPIIFRSSVLLKSPSQIRPLSTFRISSTSIRSIQYQIPRPQRSLLGHFQHGIVRREFHPSRPRRDVFFVALPALKSGLLSITRFSLLFLPFVFRYKLWQKYKKTSYALIQIPIFAICIVLALGLDQSPRTGRWRLLLMSEHEEMAWSRRKQQEVLRNDGPLILPPEDERSQQVARVTSRLITALEEQDHHIIHGASWPPRSQALSRVISEREAETEFGTTAARRHVHFRPSATAHSTFMPFRPVTSNPLKKLESADWNLYVIDLPQMNAFALPSKDIFVYTGLLSTLPEGDDSLLAAVLSHEIAHVTQRHSVENLGFLNIAAVAFDVLRGITFALTISFPMITDSAGLFINWVNDVVAERAFSRKLEQEADAVGLEIMATAGYDPRAAQDLWELMRAVEADAEAAGQAIKVENKFAMLRTHPTSEARQEALAKDMPSALKIWREHLPKRPASDVSPQSPTSQPKETKEVRMKEAQSLAT
ncbi:hypothetical protein I302_108139 [Kwoniella bestiolae CBS 10118]|uniref:Metalloendopeptidase n=1 Tax=Kwoniella bestiolae CBS 10118 TaxID=1296100 RepID=A0A1B9FWI4_9TREE|nr:metalloendopeptidase [Kwoniella bestiolae CBS 10118]OCF23142.1 metalloendopeptidase [Kwoniella bestiolae CBS 10118]